MRWHKSKLIMSLTEKGLSEISMFYDLLKKKFLVLDAYALGEEKSLRGTSLFLT